MQPFGQPLAVGTILEGRYRIVSLLGQGGMSRVHLADAIQLGMRVALKENLQTDPQARAQFQREAQILARLSHPNLPRVIDHFSDAATNRQCLVMDYIEGEDLEAMLKRVGPLPEATALAWMQQILSALEYLHSQTPPVIHRDIKPANIKITPQGKAVLVDFGIAKEYDPRIGTLTGARAVTPGYAPPEQYGLRTDKRSDLYALGATLYTTLTGRVPPESPLRTANAAVLVAPRQIVPTISPQAESAILCAMETDMTRRWRNAAQFRGALMPPAATAPGPQPRPTAPVPPAVSTVAAAPARPASALPPWALAVGGAGVMLVVALVLFGLVLGHGPTPAPTAAPPTSAPAATTAAPSVATVTGTITIWDGYHTGDNDEKTINQLVAAAQKQFPNATINVLEIPFDQLFTKFETEAATGGGPDMWTAPNDSLGKEVRAGLLQPIDDMVKGTLDPFSKLSIQALTVDGKLYAVPMIPKALAMYYNKTTVTTPPATTDDLLAAVKAGKKVGIPNSAYHTFGWWRAFGGQLMDDKGKCIADTTGVADAYTYLLSLKAAGAQIRADTDLDTLYRQGQLDIYFNGPWVLGGNEDALGKDKVGVAPMPKGPKGNAGPMTGLDGWYINVNSKNKDSAVALALFFASKDGQTLYANIAGDPPARTDVIPTDPLVKAFADAAGAGFPRPQVAQLDNFWSNFDSAATKMFEGKATPADAIKEACAAMNKANKIQ